MASPAEQLASNISLASFSKATELKRRLWFTLGALILSLPLISILAFIWLWRDTGDTARIAALAQSTFWFVLPTLPMFVVLPALLRGGMGFWPALGLSCLLTVSLYAVMVWALGRFGVTL